MEDSGTKKKKTTSNIEEEPNVNEDLRAMSLDDLNTLLTQVLEHEDYIRAIAIRDEINSRRKED